MALTVGTKKATWLCRLLQEIKILQDTTPTMIFGDNQGSLKLAQTPVCHSRIKHVDVWHHFIWEEIKSGQVTLDYVSTTDQLADILTKPLGRMTFERLRAQIGLKWITTYFIHKKTMTPPIESLGLLIGDFGKSQNKCKWFNIWSNLLLWWHVFVTNWLVPPTRINLLSHIEYIFVFSLFFSWKSCP
jgi:hypothetical protein